MPPGRAGRAVYPQSVEEFLAMKAAALRASDHVTVAALGDAFDVRLAELRVRLPAPSRVHALVRAAAASGTGVGAAGEQPPQPSVEDGVDGSGSGEQAPGRPQPRHTVFSEVNPETGERLGVEYGRRGDPLLKAEGGRKARKHNLNQVKLHVVPESEGVDTVCNGCGVKGALLTDKDAPGGLWVAKLHYGAPCKGKHVYEPANGEPYVSRKLVWQSQARARRRKQQREAEDVLLRRAQKAVSP